MTTYKLTGEGYVIKNGDMKVPVIDVPGFDPHPETVAYRQWLAAGGVPDPADAPNDGEMIESVRQSVQERLDAFARTRNYDGILSACTYATSSVPKFATEGQYAVQARDATWAALYVLLAEVQSGTRPAPASFADVQPLLPVLEWPQ